MGRSLILFQGILELFDEFSGQFRVAAGRRGIPCLVLDAKESPESLRDRIRAFRTAEPDCAAVLFNNGILPLMAEGVNVWDSLGIPVYDILLDPPIHFERYLRQPIRELRLLCADRDHVDFVRRRYPRVKKVAFFPHGGILTEGRRDYAEREIDVLFAGQCQEEREYGALTFLPEEGATFYEAVIKTMLQNPGITTENAVYRVIEEQGLKLTPQEECVILNHAVVSVEWNIRRTFKLEIIRRLGEAGIRVEVIGNHYEDPDVQWPECIHFQPATSLENVRRAMGNARISLNIMPWFKDGAHDRVFNSMLGGAVCVTDTTAYLQERFTHGKELVFYELSDLSQLVANVQWLLEHPAESAGIAECGYLTALTHDTWENRLDTLLQMMNQDDEEGTDG